MTIKDGRGFTLIELLISVGILALLVTLVIPSLTKVRQTSRDGRRKTDIQEIRVALETFRSDHRAAYPTSANFDGSGSVYPPVFLVPDYLAKVPIDPLASQKYKYVALPVGCNNSAPNMCYGYALCAKLESESGSVTDYCNGVNDCGTNVTCNYQIQNK